MIDSIFVQARIVARFPYVVNARFDEPTEASIGTDLRSPIRQWNRVRLYPPPEDPLQQAHRPDPQRGAAIAHFPEGEALVFLISLKAGGVGLDLTAADTVIHYDPWWNLAVDNQATDRAHRIGHTGVFAFSEWRSSRDYT